MADQIAELNVVADPELAGRFALNFNDKRCEEAFAGAGVHTTPRNITIWFDASTPDSADGNPAGRAWWGLDPVGGDRLGRVTRTIRLYSNNIYSDLEEGREIVPEEWRASGQDTLSTSHNFVLAQAAWLCADLGVFGSSRVHRQYLKVDKETKNKLIGYPILWLAAYEAICHRYIEDAPQVAVQTISTIGTLGLAAWLYRDRKSKLSAELALAELVAGVDMDNFVQSLGTAGLFSGIIEIEHVK